MLLSRKQCPVKTKNLRFVYSVSTVIRNSCFYIVALFVHAFIIKNL